jgi:hypothetical protein
MKLLVSAASMLLLLASAAAPAIARTNGVAAWNRRVDANICSFYGFPQHTRAFSACLTNVRRYWSTGPCAHSEFAAVHVRYCHELPPFDF